MTDSDKTLAELGLDALVTMARAQAVAQRLLARDLKATRKDLTLARKQLMATHAQVVNLGEHLLSQANRDVDEDELEEADDE